MTTYCVSFKSEDDRRWTSRSQNSWSHRECVSDLAVMIHTLTYVTMEWFRCRYKPFRPTHNANAPSESFCFFFHFFISTFTNCIFANGMINVNRAMHMEWTRQYVSPVHRSTVVQFMSICLLCTCVRVRDKDTKRESK